MKIDKKLIKELVDNLKEFNLTELEYQEGQTKIRVSRASKSIETSKTGAMVSPNKSVLKNTEDSSEGIRIKSPIIGTAYLAPEPGAKKFVDVGQKVKKGQTIMIVEAMKTMNHVPSTSDGIVKLTDVSNNYSTQDVYYLDIKATVNTTPVRTATKTIAIYIYRITSSNSVDVNEGTTDIYTATDNHSQTSGFSVVWSVNNNSYMSIDGTTVSYSVATNYSDWIINNNLYQFNIVSTVTYNDGQPFIVSKPIFS